MGWCKLNLFAMMIIFHRFHKTRRGVEFRQLHRHEFESKVAKYNTLLAPNHLCEGEIIKLPTFLSEDK